MGKLKFEGRRRERKNVRMKVFEKWFGCGAMKMVQALS